MSFENTYWSKKGKYQSLADELEALIPVEGAVENPQKNRALEKFRKASNCYYDLYNNGLCNRASEFGRIFFASRGYKRSDGSYEEQMYGRVEIMLNDIIEAAYQEQFPKNEKGQPPSPN